MATAVAKVEVGDKGAAAPQGRAALSAPLRVAQSQHVFYHGCKADGDGGGWLETSGQAAVGGGGAPSVPGLGCFPAPLRSSCGPPWGMEHEDEEGEFPSSSSEEEGEVAVECGQGWWVASVEDMCQSELEELPNDGFMSAFSNSFERIACDDLSSPMGL